MTKAELVKEVAQAADLTKKHSEVIVNVVFQSIINALHEDEKVELRGFGSFRIRQRRPRQGRNPKTGDKVQVPPKKIPYFKPGKELKQFINDADIPVTPDDDDDDWDDDDDSFEDDDSGGDPPVGGQREGSRQRDAG